MDFEILTDREQSAKNIQRYLELQGINCLIKADDKDWRLLIKEKFSILTTPTSLRIASQGAKLKSVEKSARSYMPWLHFYG